MVLLGWSRGQLILAASLLPLTVLLLLTAVHLQLEELQTRGWYPTDLGEELLLLLLLLDSGHRLAEKISELERQQLLLQLPLQDQRNHWVD